MAKGKIKNIGENDMGVIVENDTDREISFYQPFIRNMEVGIGYPVQFDAESLSDGRKVAVRLNPNRRGLLSTVVPDEKRPNLYSGELTDTITNAVYGYQAIFPAGESPAPGIRVRFELFRTEDGKSVAVNLEPTENQPKR